MKKEIPTDMQQMLVMAKMDQLGWILDPSRSFKSSKTYFSPDRQRAVCLWNDGAITCWEHLVKPLWENSQTMEDLWDECPLEAVLNEEPNTGNAAAG